MYPLILPLSLPLVFVKMMESLRSFDFIFVLTAGGPGIATETLDMYAYWQGSGPPVGCRTRPRCRSSC
jgi:ABC-type sugar transport system permease subunit